MNTLMASFRVTLLVKEKRQYVEELLRLTWCGITLPMHSRWEWYFKYREALARIAWPKAFIELTVIREEPDKRTVKNVLELRVIDRKGQLTKHLNRVDKMKKQWAKDDPMNLTPIENLPNWCKVIEKEKLLREQLREASDALAQHLIEP